MDQDTQALRDEKEKMQRLRLIVDGTAHCLIHGDYSLEEVEGLILQTRSRVLELFPDKGELFDLIYPSRFRRLFRDWSDRGKEVGL